MKEQQSNYSFETSHEPYKENIVFNKQRQCEQVLAIIRKGGNNLLQISQVSGIPQAVISARMSDLLKDGKAAYDGFTIFNNRKRKKIKWIQNPTPVIGLQGKMF